MFVFEELKSILGYGVVFVFSLGMCEEDYFCWWMFDVSMTNHISLHKKIEYAFVTVTVLKGPSSLTLNSLSLQERVL